MKTLHVIDIENVLGGPIDNAGYLTIQRIYIKH